jgi:hypothetical protein
VSSGRRRIEISIQNSTKAVAPFADWPVPVIYLADNHEFFRAIMGADTHRAASGLQEQTPAVRRRAALRQGVTEGLTVEIHLIPRLCTSPISQMRKLA